MRVPKIKLLASAVGVPVLRLIERRQFVSQRCHSYSSSNNNSPERLLVSLERSVGARQGVDRDLAGQGSFDCEVYPDLPVDTDWRGFFGRLLTR